MTSPSASVKIHKPFRLAVWVAVLLSPTLYFLLLILASRLPVPTPPEALAPWLFFLIPVVALLVCESLVWSSSMTVARKVVWALVSLLGILLQVGIVLALIIAVTAAIGYAQ